MTMPVLAPPSTPRPEAGVPRTLSIPTPATRPEHRGSRHGLDDPRPASGETHSRPRTPGRTVRSAFVVLALVAAGWFAMRSLPSWSSLVNAFTTTYR
ncbi:hypothetical protein SAMN04487818_10641 [Actinokineospora terrae]|uniref:Uncharacterized protein n=1 Tax=Actinokineospora terrae TaxID=155974 RepID=A0A1H9T2W1_9PSEU|nr:hypothetical protein SAMN04487818_10641 [Actinokineospora terrae]